MRAKKGCPIIQNLDEVPTTFDKQKDFSVDKQVSVRAGPFYFKHAVQAARCGAAQRWRLLEVTLHT